MLPGFGIEFIAEICQRPVRVASRTGRDQHPPDAVVGVETPSEAEQPPVHPPDLGPGEAFNSTLSRTNPAVAGHPAVSVSDY